MNARLFRYAAISAVLPLSGVVLILTLQNHSLAAAIVLASVSVLQLPVILFCRKAVKPFIAPDMKVLEELKIDYIPAAYEPGKFRIDSRVASVIIWLGLLAPFMAWLSVHFPKEVTVTVLNFATYTAPDMNLMLPAILLPMVSGLALPFWFETARANTIYSEINDRKRYLLRGFAEGLCRHGGVQVYEAACKRAKE